MFNGVSFHGVDEVKSKSCVVCSTSFIPRSGVHKFCSERCKGKWKYITGDGSTANQYTRINGNWKRYVSRLLYSHGGKRSDLTQEMLLSKLEEQGYKCALSGVDLTCTLEKGKRSQTNASIDRIIAGGQYSNDNIQIVCRALNSWRSDTSIEDFVQWCRKVVEKFDGEEKKKLS